MSINRLFYLKGQSPTDGNNDTFLFVVDHNKERRLPYVHMISRIDHIKSSRGKHGGNDSIVTITTVILQNHFR